MAIFIDLEEDTEPPQTQAVGGGYGEWNNEITKLQRQQELLAAVNTANAQQQAWDSSVAAGVEDDSHDLAAATPDKGMSENLNRTSRMTEALACYPYVKSESLSLHFAMCLRSQSLFLFPCQTFCCSCSGTCAPTLWPAKMHYGHPSLRKQPRPTTSTKT